MLDHTSAGEIATAPMLTAATSTTGVATSRTTTVSRNVFRGPRAAHGATATADGVPRAGPSVAAVPARGGGTATLPGDPDTSFSRMGRLTDNRAPPSSPPLRRPVDNA
ncbi:MULTISPECIES: hypothetical protein [Protofrankia]|uniref:hypothetical protein n=1 Tax=Protofrankia TaxID=2994361 RepID=UPI0001C53207|nr:MULTISPECIES: hypothetical protein [Protofrankia]